MQSKDLQTETMSVTPDDYKYSLTMLYKHYTEELKHHENKYNDWVQTAQVYALSKVDGNGKPVPANIKAYNDTVIERRRLSIMIKFLQNEIDFIEQFWVNKGFNLEELRKSTKSKKLHKFNPIVKPKEQVIGTNTDNTKKSESKTENQHKTLIALKSGPPVQENDDIIQETGNDNIKDNSILSLIEGNDSDDANEEDS